MFLELKFLAVPSEESHTSLLKSKLDIRTVFKFIFGALGTISFLIIVIFPFLKISLLFNPYLLFGGICLVAAGRILTFKGSLDINKHFEQSKGVLLNKGIFSYTRNPILLGLHISLLGFLMAIGNYQLGLLSLLFYVGMHVKVIDEEKFLIQKFGLPYKKYKESTKRYL